MNIEEFRDYCIAKKGVTEELPFGPDTLVFKVTGKIFALTALDSEIFRVNLKCDPDYALELREKFDYIVGAFHMNKKHWNTVDGDIASTKQLQELTDHSYDLVVAGFSKKEKEAFNSV